MAQISRFWITNDVGDGPAVGYSRTDLFDFYRSLFTPGKEETQGVIRGHRGELLCTGTISPIFVASGAGFSYGFWYENTSQLELGVTTPASLTGGRVVLRADWTAQEVRAFIKMSPDGTPTPPALTQVIGSNWEISIANFTIDPAGNIVLSDERAFCEFGSVIPEGVVETNDIVDGAITTPKLADEAVTAIKIAPLEVTTSRLNDEAVTTEKLAINSVESTILANLAVINSKLGIRSVTEDKIDLTSVGNEHMQVNAIHTQNILDEAVTIEKLTPGLVFSRARGGMFLSSDGAPLILDVGNVPQQITMADAESSSVALGMVVDILNGTITISAGYAGDYILMLSFSAQIDTLTEYYFTVNIGLHNVLRAHIDSGNLNNNVNVTLTGMGYLIPNDIISIWAHGENASNSLAIEASEFYTTRIG